jgi:hypothetical protein
METYEGIIICESQRPFLRVNDGQPRFLLLMQLIEKKEDEDVFEKTFYLLSEKNLIGKKVSIIGNIEYHLEVENHQNCDETLFFTEDSVKEI